MTNAQNSPNPNIRRNYQAAGQATIRLHDGWRIETTAAAAAVAKRHNNDTHLMYQLAKCRTRSRAHGEAALFLAAILHVCSTQDRAHQGTVINRRWMCAQRLLEQHTLALAGFLDDPMMFAVWSQETQAAWA
jgi:hypothetical protein